MNTIKALAWLRENNLYAEAEKYSNVLKNIFLPCLSIKEEKILIIGDTGFNGRNVSAILSGAYYLAASKLNLDAKLCLQEVKFRGDDAEEHIVDALAGLSEKNVLFLSMSDKLGSIGDLGKSFRKWSSKRKHRFVSAMSLGDIPNDKLNVITDAIDVNYKPMQAEHEILKQKFDSAKEVHVTTPAGTDLYYNIKGTECIKTDGDYTKEGTGGNLPAGQVYMPPNAKNVSGKVVVDASSRNHRNTILINKPITLTVENGSITEISGAVEAKKLEEALAWAESVSKKPGGIRRVSEFGIGLNPRAKLSGAMVVDDKVRGTAHIGIGSNYWFGGKIYAILHLDQVFNDPKIEIDDEELKI